MSGLLPSRRFIAVRTALVVALLALAGLLAAFPVPVATSLQP
jgi:hypothetical protein